MSTPSPSPVVKSLRADRLGVEIFASRTEMGRAAGKAAADHLRELLARQSTVRAIFACAPSQNEFLGTLTSEPDIAWPRITAFHMDEYVGLSAEHPASFRSYLRQHLLGVVKPSVVHLLAGDAPNSADECERYGALLAAAPVHAVFLGIGENGHLAFNDPPVANFRDPARVKVVELDQACREQQVHDGCFPSLAQVPRQALTLTIPTLVAGARMFCVVPGPRKAAAVEKTIFGPIGTECPASILRNHPAATLYLDRDSGASLLKPARSS